MRSLPQRPVRLHAAYVPGLHRRHATEFVLTAEAAGQGWSGEVERHAATARCFPSLLDELREPLDCPARSDRLWVSGAK